MDLVFLQQLRAAFVRSSQLQETLMQVELGFTDAASDELGQRTLSAKLVINLVTVS